MATPPASNKVMYALPDGDGKFTSNYSGPDTIPDAFSLAPQANAVANTPYTRDVTVSGINTGIPISVSAGTYKINGGTATSLPGTVHNGDVVTVILTASASAGAAVNMILSLNGVTNTFTVTTQVTSGGGTVFARGTFTDGSITPAPITPDAVWDHTVLGGSTLTVESGKLKGTNPLASSDNDIVVGVRANIVQRNVWMKFKAQFFGTPHAIKFCKVHGKTTAGYANCTFGVDGGGEISRFSFGDGTHDTNDTGYILFYDGTYPELTGRNYGLATIETPQHSSFAGSLWNNEIHEFWLCIGFNSGTTAENEVNDGYMMFYIDGHLYGKITNMFNRHYSNDIIDYISFFDVAQGSDYGYVLYYDDIVLSVDGWE